MTERIDYSELPLIEAEYDGKKRFELKIGDKTAFMDYMIVSGANISLPPTAVPVGLEGKGVGSAIVEKVIAYVRDNNLKIAPLCPFLAAYLKKYPEAAEGILAPGFKVG